jgi:hypothetical protein
MRGLKSGQISGAALVLGALGGIVTMAVHPTGVQLNDAVDLARQAHATRLAHGVALCSMPLMLFGLADFSRRTGFARMSALAGLSFYAFAIMAVLGAALMSGMVMGELIDAWPAALLVERPGLHRLMDYTHDVNQAYAAVFTLASAAAIFVWSLGLLAMKRGGLLGWIGVVVGVAEPLLIAFAGHDALSVHGFLLLTLMQGVWLVGVGVLLWKGWSPAPPEPETVVD